MGHYLVNIDTLPEDDNVACKKLLEDNRQVMKAMTEFFGEEFTDYRIATNCYDDVYCLRCIIWYPEITVTNEREDSITIKDLYVYFDISPDNCISSIYMRRGTMTTTEVAYRYVHSHCPSLSFTIEKTRPTMNMMSCCLGRSPLNHTLIRLLNSKEDMDIWKLFFMEIDRYAHTESLSGGPYVKMSYLTNSTPFRRLSHVVRQDILDYQGEPRGYNLLKPFLNEYLNTQSIYSNGLKFAWDNDRYSLAMSPDDYFLDISNKFIKWYNDTSIKCHKPDLDAIIDKSPYCIKDGSLYTARDMGTQINEADGAHVGWFKGKEVTLKIIRNENTQDRKLTLIRYELASYVLSRILCAVNMPII